MSKRKGSKAAAAAAVDETSVAKDRVVDTESNSKLADFAKGKNAADAKKAAAKLPKKGKDGMPKLPNLPRGAGKPKALKPCECGCGLQTKSKFAPGHDSRLRGWALRIARGLVKLEDITGKYECSQGEQDAVAAHVKQLKKEGKWEALKTAQVPVKKAAKPTVDEVADESDDDTDDEE